jgi:hypothetical protein
VWQGHFLIVESANGHENGDMLNDPDPSAPRRTWLAMLAPLPMCFSCGISLNTTTACVDGFCRECLERSRNGSHDPLGGEA